MFTDKRALWKKFSVALTLFCFVLWTGQQPKVQRSTEESGKIHICHIFHKVGLTEEKWVWNHRKEICALHMLLHALSWWGECVTNSSVLGSSAFHSLCSANSPSHRKNSCDFDKCVGTRSQTVLRTKEVILVFLYTPPALLFPPCCCMAYLLLSIQKWAQPERCHFRVASRSFSVGKVEEMEMFRKGIFQPHAASFLQPSLNLCLFYTTFILSVCLS